VYDADAGTTFNEAGENRDFRVESNSVTHMLFVDASANHVGIQTSAPQAAFQVNSVDPQSTTLLSVRGNGNNIEWGHNNRTSGYYGVLGANNNNGNPFIAFSANANSGTSNTYDTDGFIGTILRGTTGGELSIEQTLLADADDQTPVQRFGVSAVEIVVNEASTNTDFRVESDFNTHMLFMDAGSNVVAFGVTASPYDSASNEGFYYNYGGSLDIASNTNTLRINRNGTGGNNRTNIELQNNGNTRGYIGSFGPENGMYLHNTSNIFISGFTDEVVINDESADLDFRVESDSSTHALFVDAGNNRVGVLASAPRVPLEVGSFGTAVGMGETQIALAAFSGSFSAGLTFFDDNGEANAQQFYFDPGTCTLKLLTTTNSGTNKYNRMEIQGNAAGGEVSFNQDGQNHDFRVESDNNSNALFVDASSDQVLFGVSSANITTNAGYFATNTTSYHLALGNTSTSAAAANIYVNRQNVNGVSIQFRRANLDVGSITVSTTGTQYNTNSDRRLKTDIEPIANGTEKLMAMNPVTHKWKADPDADVVHGFIAQEMQEIVPEAVSGDPDGEEMMSMDYGRITPVLVAALQDAHNKIAALEERLAELENR
jgi:hypothetical protein